MATVKPVGATSPQEYLDAIDEPRRSDIVALDQLIRATTGADPAWTGGMLGYVPFRYRYASGREGDSWVVSLASQK